MLVARSDRRTPADADPVVSDILALVSPDRIRATVESLSYPRHYLAQPAANRRARDWLVAQLRDLGHAPTLQGPCDNVVAASAAAGPYTLLAAHYDSVPGTPGADDNASAVAAVLEAARVLAAADAPPASFVLFNREEDGLIGSREFVADLPAGAVAEAHVFEMVGYRSRKPGSQRTPPGLPPGIAAPTVGDFLGLLANRRSNGIAERLLPLAAAYTPDTPALALKVYLGAERFFGHLLRSDHAPFWEADIPAVMWTDTSEFRNPHYHRPTDTPDTLDYDFLADVTRLAVARVLTGPGGAS